MNIRLLILPLFLFTSFSAEAQMTDSLEAISVTQRLSDLYKQGQYPKACIVADTAIKVWEHLKNWEKVADCRRVRLYCLGLTRRLDEAQKEGELLQKMCEAHLPEGHLKWGQLYNSRVALHVWRGDYVKAVSWSKKQNEFWKNQETLESAGALINRGVAFYYISENWQSIESCQLGLKILNNIGKKDHLFAAHAHLCIGRSYLSLRHFRESEQYFRKALAIYEKKLRPEHPSLVVARFNIYSLYYQKEDCEKALEQGRFNLEITKKALGRNNHTAKDYANIGRALMKLGRLEEAVSNLKEALSIQQEILPPSHPDIALTRLFIRRVYRVQKRFALSKEILELGLRKVVDNRISNVRNDMYRAIGYIYEEQKQWELAITWFDKCLGAFKSEGKWLSIAHRRGIIQLLVRKANVLIQWDSISEIQRYTRAAATLIESRDLLDSMRHFIRPEEESAHAQNAEEIYGLGAYVCYELYKIHQSDYWLEESFSFAEKRRSSLLLQSLRSRQAHRFAGVPASLLNTERAAKTGLLYSEQQLQTEKAKGSSADSLQLLRWEEEMLVYRYQLDSVRSLVSKSYPSYHRMKYDEHTAKLSEVQQQVQKEQSAFVQFSWTPDYELIVFFASPGKRGAIKIPHSKAFQDSLTQFIAMINDGIKAENTGYTPASKAAFSKLSAALYHGLLAPVMAQLNTSTDRLIVIPQGQLGYLPFSLLLTQQPGKGINWVNMPFLLHEHALRYAWSATLFCAKENPSNYQGRLLGGFAPDYRHLDETSNFLATRSAAPLTANQPEVELIASMTGGKSHLSADASETTFKSLARQYSILHLAMHALVNDSFPLYSSLVFSNQNEEENEDGQLYAYEIYNLPLQAELLVLSACETGYGKQREGEGIMSLAHAFHYAGCPNIVTSLWQADDKSTARLMELFYAELKKGAPKDKALQVARLAYLAEGNQAHPFFWGAFVLVGDDEPVALGGRDFAAGWFVFVLIAACLGWFIFQDKSTS
jgi:CHAT domain-containing protein